MINGVYLAYPIDQATPAMAELWEKIEYFKMRLLAEGGVAWVFDPGDAFTVNPNRHADDRLGTINRAALNNSDLVVAFLPAGVPSIGVPMEIDRARAQGKHVIVFSDSPSFMLNMPRVQRYSSFTQEVLYGVAMSVQNMDPPIEQRQVADLPCVVEDPGYLPRRSYEDDAGLDLIVSETTTIRPGAFADVPCGLSVELPPWAWGLVTGRSSALRKRGLLVHSGVIDAGYRGPLFAGAWNLSEHTVTVKAGERVAQLIVLNNSTRLVEPIAVQGLTPSARGNHGFGSTGD